VVNFERHVSRAVLLPKDDIDTDQIIPARYLKTTKKDGLRESLFADWRYLPDGEESPDFALNQPSAEGASVLVVGETILDVDRRESMRPGRWSTGVFELLLRNLLQISFAPTRSRMACCPSSLKQKFTLKLLKP
jgi:hypothetical protein